MPSVKMTVSVSLDHHLWRSFQEACRTRGIIPSHEFERFIKEQLATWQTITHTKSRTRRPPTQKGGSS